MKRIKSKKSKKLNKIFTWIIFALALISGSTYGINSYIKAKADDVVYKKGVMPNKVNGKEDGTYKISLDITGATSTETATSKANIVLVYDVSGSMIDPQYTSYYEDDPDNPKYENSGKYYGYRITENVVPYTNDEGEVVNTTIQNGSFELITKDEEGVWKFTDGTTYNNGNDKLGRIYRRRDRYTTDYHDNVNYDELPTRASAAETVTRRFIQQLLAFNEGLGDND